MKAKTKPSPFVVIVDTREQRPFKFGEITDSRGHALEVTTCRYKLDAGDYSIQGLEGLIAVERKTQPDKVRQHCVGLIYVSCDRSFYERRYRSVVALRPSRNRLPILRERVIPG